MISRAILRGVVTHGLSVAIGLCVTVALTKRPELREPQESQSVTTRSDKRARLPTRRGLSSSESFKSTYQELASCSMTSGERKGLRSRLFAEWGKRDPLGLLTFLERTQVWPEEFSYSMNVGDLERERPDLLLDFSIRNGCEPALSSLHYGDPVVVSRLIDALPDEQKGPKLLEIRDSAYREMGTSGIMTATPNADNLSGAAEAMLEDGRMDEFFDTIGRIDDETTRRNLAESLGEALAEEKPGFDVLSRISPLPKDLQILALSRLFRLTTGETMIFPEAREIRRQWIGQLAGQGMAEATTSGIDDLFQADDSENVNREILEWAKTFPADGSWKAVEKETFSEWSRFDPSAMVAEIGAMPDDPLREKLAIGAAKGMRNHGLSGDDGPLLARIMSLISDPAVLKEFELEDSTPADPFAD
jgi:hypothetical protein